MIGRMGRVTRLVSVGLVAGAVAAVPAGAGAADEGFSQGGGQIAYSAPTAGGSLRYLHVAALDGSGDHQLTAVGSTGDPVFSPDATLIAFSYSPNEENYVNGAYDPSSSGKMSDGRPGLFLIRPDGSGLTRAKCGCGGVTWSLDGTQLLASGQSDGPLPPNSNVTFGSSDIVVYELASQTTTHITSQSRGDPAYASQPAWSPDQRFIAYVSEAFQQAPQIHVRDLVTGADRVVASGRSPRWSPDGKRLAFNGPNPVALQQANVSVINSDGTGLRTLSLPHVDESDPQWSADGSLLTFTARQFGAAPYQFVGPPVLVALAPGPLNSDAQRQSTAPNPTAATIRAQADTPCQLWYLPTPTGATTVSVHASQAQLQSALICIARAQTGHAGQPTPRCHVPRLVGLDLRAARRALLRAGCRLGRLSRSARTRRRARPNRIGHQGIRAGKTVAIGTPVAIRLTR